MASLLRMHLLTAAAVLLARPSPARIDLVTLPARDQTQITIYNSDDLTLVREQRTLTFAPGVNAIQFSWAGTLIDPTSPQLFFLDQPGNFSTRDITYPAGTRNLLVWNIEAEEGGPGRVEIQYFLSGVSWRADYVVKANAEETQVALEGYVRVANKSGEEFKNTQTRLIVGTVNLVDKIAELARMGIPTQAVVSAISMGDVYRVKQGNEPVQLFSSYDKDLALLDESGKMKEVVKQAISEYQLYTIEGTEDLPDGWSKRLRSFAAADVKIEVAYESDPKYGPGVVKFYKLRNDAEHNLGKDPLPEGIYRVVRQDGENGLVWCGRHEEKYVPIGEKLELNLGPDGLVTIEDKPMKFERLNLEFDVNGDVTGWDERTAWRIEIRNSRSSAIPIKITRHPEGDWDLAMRSEPTVVKYTKKDKSTTEFETTVSPQSTGTVEYVLTVHQGTRSGQDPANRN